MRPARSCASGIGGHTSKVSFWHAHLAWREGDIAIRAVGEWLGVTLGAVSKLIRGSELLETHDATYRGQLDRLRKHLRDSGDPRKSEMGWEGAP